MLNDQNDSEKFYNTYGKETSFEIFPQEASYKAPKTEEIPPHKISVAHSIQKYLALLVFIALISAIVLVGGIFMIGLLAIMLVGMLVRKLISR